jgi:hypothetical protein
LLQNGKLLFELLSILLVAECALVRSHFVLKVLAELIALVLRGIANLLRILIELLQQ